MSKAQAKRRRFYQFDAGTAQANPSDFEWLNRDACLINGRCAGTHAVMWDGWPHHPQMLGIPELIAQPVIKVGLKNKIHDIYGLRQRFVSTRAKQLLQQIDPDGFEFAECVTTAGRGRQIETYWMMEVIRPHSSYDAELSQVVTARELNPDADPATIWPGLAHLNDVHFTDVGNDQHAFRFLPKQNATIFDEVIVDAWRAAGLSGATFTPLQPPTKAELRQLVSFHNFPYWYAQQAQLGDVPT